MDILIFIYYTDIGILIIHTVYLYAYTNIYSIYIYIYIYIYSRLKIALSMKHRVMTRCFR